MSKAIECLYGNLSVMKKRGYYILGVVFGFLLSIVIVLLLGRESVLYCSPNSPRVSGVAEWEKTISPVQPAEQFDEDFFDNFVVDSNSKSLTFQQPPYNSVENSFAFELAEMTPDEPLDIGDGRLEFSYIGIAYLDANQMLDDDVAYRFYDARFERIGETRVRELGNRSIFENGSDFRYLLFPIVRFAFESRNIKDIMFHGIKIFDARTHKLLSRGHSRSKGENRSWFTGRIPIWHRAPIDVVMDVSYGPTKIFEFAPRGGEGFEEGIFKCHLIGVFEGVDMYTYDTSKLPDDMVTRQLFKTQGDRAGLCFFFFCWPLAHQMQVTFEFLDTDGNILNGRNCSSTSGNIHTLSLRQPLERVALIRARYRTMRKRIVLQLPYIPGLPEENDAIDNLFDVRIPYVRLRNAKQAEHFLMRTLQLRRSRSTGPIPPSSFDNTVSSLDFNDVTVGQIAERYGEGSILVVDLENEQLRREYPVSFLRRLEQYLEKLFR